jgi:hypothetical protein
VRENVDSVSRFDGFVRQLEERSTRDDASVVDKHIHLADFLFYYLGDFIDSFLVGDIDNISGAFEAFGIKRFCGRLDR